MSHDEVGRHRGAPSENPKNWQASVECTTKKEKKALGQPAAPVDELCKGHVGCCVG